VKRIITMTSALIVAAGLGCGLAAASASAAPSAPAASGAEHFELIATSLTSPTSITLKAIYYGVVTGSGTDVSQNRQTYDTVHLPGGTFRLNYGTAPRLRVISAATCSASGSATYTYKFTDGTGAYKRITGSGTMVVSELAILGRSGGKCSQRAAPAALFVVVNGHGSARR
jgi:hypothetical protein